MSRPKGRRSTGRPGREQARRRRQGPPRRSRRSESRPARKPAAGPPGPLCPLCLIYFSFAVIVSEINPADHKSITARCRVGRSAWSAHGAALDSPNAGGRAAGAGRASAGPAQRPAAD